MVIFGCITLVLIALAITYVEIKIVRTKSNTIDDEDDTNWIGI